MRAVTHRLRSLAHGVLPGWRTILACLLVLVFAGSAMDQLNALLAGMRTSGRPAVALSDLGPPFRLPDAERTNRVLDVWKEYDVAVRESGNQVPTADAHLAGGWFVLVDSFLFAPAYTLALLVFLWLAPGRTISCLGRERERLDRAAAARGDPPRDPSSDELDDLATRETLVRGSALGIAAIALTFVFDELENWAYWRILDTGLRTKPIRSDDVNLLAVASTLKWTFALLAVLVFLALAWRWIAARTGAGSDRAAAARLRLIAPLVVLVLLFGAALVASEQFHDLIRRWTVWQLLVSTGLAALFAVVVWLASRRLLAVGQADPSDERKRMVTLALFGSIVVAAVVQLGLFWLMRGSERHLGWGLAIPAAILGVLALLTWLLPDSKPTEAAERRREQAVPVPSGERSASSLPLPRALAAATVLLFAFGVFQASFGYAVYTRQWNWTALVPAGAAALALCLALFRRPVLLPAIAAGAVATVVLTYWDEDDADASLLVVGSLLIALAGSFAYRALESAAAPKQHLRLRDWVPLLVVPIGFGVATVVRPIEVGQALGVAGVLAAFLTALAILATMLIWLNGAIAPPLALRELGLVRFPMLTFVLVWFVAAGLADRGGYHDVRVVESDQAAIGVTIEEAFDCWLVKNRLPPLEETRSCPARAGAASLRGRPLVLVASTGGGIRAGFWTALVLDCAFERELPDVDPRAPCREEFAPTLDRSNTLFALSGISGGSVGFASYAAYLSEKESGSGAAWVADRLSTDALSPSGAWWLFVELPRIFLQFETRSDRSEILETAWERQWSKGSLTRGLFSLWRDHPEVPLLLMNGTSVADACRFNASVLDGNVETSDAQQPNCRSGSPFDERQDEQDPPTAGVQNRLHGKSALAATRDLSDFLCSERLDVPLSAAAFLSARFPFVNPSGRIERRCSAPGVLPAVAYVVDGGYLDTSGASPLVELSARLGPLIDLWNARHAADSGCVVPFMIQIDNGFEDEGKARPSRRPPELTLPLTTVFEARIGRAAQARAAAGLLFNQPFPATIGETPADDRYAHFVNQAHPGPRAPLGWVQSRASEQELRDQRVQRKNRQALAEVRQWLTSPIRCTG